MINNYIIKYSNEDFLVEEIAIFPQKNNGFFSIFELEKSNITTFSAIKEIKNQINTPKIGYCGLKDEHAITKQSISIKTQDIIVDKLDIKLKNGFIRLKKIDDGFDSHLKIGNLLGNKFKITLRNISNATLEDFKMKYPKHKIYLNYINYYDEQRFGLPNDIKNTHIIGEHLLNNNYEYAFNEILISKSEYKNELIHELHLRNSYEDAINTLPKNVFAFYINSHMSFIWNEKAKNHIKSIVNQNNLKCYDYFNDDFSTVFFNYGSNFSIDSQSNLLEYEYYSSRNEKKSTFRKLINSSTIYVSNIARDELFENKYKIELNFMLESGNYATMLIKQLMGVLK